MLVCVYVRLTVRRLKVFLSCYQPPFQTPQESMRLERMLQEMSVEANRKVAEAESAERERTVALTEA
jgi:hypothetical protein